jgi:hypothetical protein
MGGQVDVVNREPGAEFRVKINAINGTRRAADPST